MIRFQQVVHDFENDVRMANLQQQKSTLNNPASIHSSPQKPKMQSVSTQVKGCSEEVESLKRRLHNITQENIELSRVIQEMNKPLDNKGVQTDEVKQPKGRNSPVQQQQK